MIMNEIEDLKKENDTLSMLAASVIDCGTLDIECILEMERNFPGTIERAIDLREEFKEQINFGVFVRAVQEIAIDSISAELVDGDEDLFREIVIDDNYSDWGGIASYGDRDFPEELQECFVEYVRGLSTIEKFLESYREYRTER